MLLFRSGGARFTTFIQSLKAYHGLNPHDDPEETAALQALLTMLSCLSFRSWSERRKCRGNAFLWKIGRQKNEVEMFIVKLVRISLAIYIYIFSHI